MSIYEQHKPAGGSGDYLRLKDGDRVKLRFASDPAVVTYDGKKLRYQWVVYNRNSKAAQIYESGPQVFGQLAELYPEWGDPKDFDVTLSRTGSGQFDTSYTVTPSPKSVDLTEEEQEKILAIKFPSERSKLLEEYEKDRIMPETIPTKKSAQTEGDDPISLENIPF